MHSRNLKGCRNHCASLRFRHEVQCLLLGPTSAANSNHGGDGTLLSREADRTRTEQNFSDACCRHSAMPTCGFPPSSFEQDLKFAAACACAVLPCSDVLCPWPLRPALKQPLSLPNSFDSALDARRMCRCRLRNPVNSHPSKTPKQAACFDLERWRAWLCQFCQPVYLLDGWSQILAEEARASRPSAPTRTG